MHNWQPAQMRLECPMPKVDYEVITLGHGSGGILSRNLLHQFILEALGNTYLDKEHDGSILNITGALAITTDSFVVSPIFFPGGNIGHLAVHGTVNDLAMCGAVPRYLSLSFILEEGLPLDDFWDVLLAIRWASRNLNIEIVTGDTKVVDKGKGDKIFINTTGIGNVLPEARIDARRIAHGDKVICSGPIGTHGMAIMSQREGLEFDSAIESDTRSVAHLAEALIKRFGMDIRMLRDPTRGGLGTSLVEIARTGQAGIELQQSSIPVQPQVVAACEILGLDPLYVANEGMFVALVAPSIADEAVECLRKLDGGQQASVIGEVTDAHPGQVLITSGIGGSRVVNMLVGEQLPRIC